ncbi:trypsin-1-like [Chironomus tepperi]|uniref:trypsin-1-like n=1 Tax=Chironomus tepperi TaxID=113505 RepID=UPI00391EE651
MKFLLILSIYAVYSATAVPYSLNNLERIFGPYNGLRLNPDARIVGGDAANITDYPYQGSLLSSLRHICGCNIISSHFVFTAAHCTNGAVASMLSVRVGSSFLGRDGDVIKVAQIIQHPSYNSWNIDYDFSLLRLQEELVFSERVQPIKFPCAGEDFRDGTIVSTSGWGNTMNSSISNEQLRVVYVVTINQQVCINAYAKINSAVTPRGYLIEGGKDACQGDSGGPLAAPHTDTYLESDGVLIGLVSWGYGCARPNFPGVYSRISAVSDWVMDKTGIKTCYRVGHNDYQIFNNQLLRDIEV